MEIQNCSEASSSLLLVNLDDIILVNYDVIKLKIIMFQQSYLFHLQSLGGFIIIDSTSIKQKPSREHEQLALHIAETEPSQPASILT